MCEVGRDKRGGPETPRWTANPCTSAGVQTKGGRSGAKLRWRFASGEHRDLFVKDPARYAPQYDGYCALGAADGAGAHKDSVDPEA